MSNAQAIRAFPVSEIILKYTSHDNLAIAINQLYLPSLDNTFAEK
jgi:hypothetical protein